MTLGDNAVSVDVEATNASNAASTIFSDFSATGISPTRQSAGRQDYQDASGLTPNQPRTAGKMSSGVKSSSSKLLLYGGGAVAVLALVALVRRK